MANDDKGTNAGAVFDVKTPRGAANRAIKGDLAILDDPGNKDLQVEPLWREWHVDQIVLYGNTFYVYGPFIRG